MRTKNLGVLAVVFLVPLLSASCAHPENCWLGGYYDRPCTIIGVMEEKAKAAEHRKIRIERERAEERAWAQKSADPEFQARLAEQLRIQREACEKNSKPTSSGWVHSC